MAIYTKGGDNGSTSLAGGTRVPKNHPKVEAYGNVDELISHLGLIRALADDELAATIRRIQQNLMMGSAHFASDGKYRLKAMDDSETEFLEKEIDRMTDAMPAMKAFVLPAGPALSSECHIARTVCRRAERSSIELASENEDCAKTVRYLNRLSDYLFTLARYISNTQGEGDDFWLP